MILHSTPPVHAEVGAEPGLLPRVPAAAPRHPFCFPCGVFLVSLALCLLRWVRLGSVVSMGSGAACEQLQDQMPLLVLRLSLQRASQLAEY